VGALLALLGISLPGLLLVAGVLPFWDRLGTKAGVQAAVQGVNATVVGILAAALYNPLLEDRGRHCLGCCTGLGGMALARYQQGAGPGGCGTRSHSGSSTTADLVSRGHYD
jgi:chromate transport protein ChrA